MKRSEINNYLKEAKIFLSKNNFLLPPWAFWSPNDWQNKGDECKEIEECLLGWDITDFGSDDYEKIGLFLFTLRNGKYKSSEFDKTYAEKIMIVKENQVTPTHFHWKKTEDIINRGPGVLKIQLWMSSKDEKLSEESFNISIDGVNLCIKGGDYVELNPGESITLRPFMYHNFYAEREMTLVGEVSSVNDDKNDNRFLNPAGRFPEIVEDEEALHPLCNEYP